MKGEAPMRRFTTPLLLSAVLVAGALAVPSLYAQDQKPSGSMMDHGMTGGKDGKDADGMMGMMKMMRQMGEMMDHCSNMMKDSGKSSPSEPEKKG
jgi:hypothetical protein